MTVALSTPRPRARRSGFDVDEYTPALGRVVGNGHSVEATRAAVMVALRRSLDQGREALARRLARDDDGDAYMVDHARLLDRIVMALFQHTTERLFPVANPTTSERLALVALGGYGRGELGPFSDLDLLFLLPYKRTPRVEQVVEHVLYTLWDLGLKVGHAVRSIDECVRLAKGDVLIRTSLLDRRFIAGEEKLFRDLDRKYHRGVEAGSETAFVQAKLAERDARHKRWGDSRYVLEPNVKEGKGGLRDLHTLQWIAKTLYGVQSIDELVPLGKLTAEEAQRFAKAQTFLRTVRCWLQLTAGRLEDRLTFDLQTEIGQRLAYTDHAGAKGVERFMKHYFLVAKDVGDLTRVLCADFEASSGTTRWQWLRRKRPKKVGGFLVVGDRLDIARDDQFARDPVDMIRLFATAHDKDYDVHPHALRAIRRELRGIGPDVREDPEANRLFLDVLTGARNPETTLRRMNEAGVLGRFVPDFGRVVAQMQYDMYHWYTVDEHTLQAMGILHRIAAGEMKDELPLASELIHQIASHRALSVALLLHDIAKGRGGDHSVLGAKVAQQLGPRLGLSPEEVETASWLVRWHLAMSDAAFKRDLEDEETVRAFAELVQSPERLKLLAILTSTDIRAVGPGRWNAWKSALLTELYLRTDEWLATSTGEQVNSRARARIEALKERTRELLPQWTDAEFDRFARLGSGGYWLAFDPAAHAHHGKLAREAQQLGREFVLATRDDVGRDVTEVTVYAADHPGLFARLAGAIAWSGLTIVDAKIHTLTNGMALDVFSVQDASGSALDGDPARERLTRSVERALAGKLLLSKELARKPSSLPRRARSFQVTPRVLTDNGASKFHTVIEINGRDRPGLLHALTTTLTRLSLTIATAKISTYGHKVVDVFYVRDVFGMKITDESKLTKVREALLKALAEPEEKKSA
jgi:[protein-PII] uridylyltransferase